MGMIMSWLYKQIMAIYVTKKIGSSKNHIYKECLLKMLKKMCRKQSYKKGMTAAVLKKKAWKEIW